MKPAKRAILTLVAAIAVLAVVAVAFIYSGGYDVAATTGHTKPVEQALRTLMMRSVVAHARNVTPPPNFNAKDRELAEHAAGHYEMMCRTCHGAPGKKPDPWQLYPPAPDLADALRVTNWSDAEVFWIIKNGIKDTGMSAFGGSHSDEDIWGLTALIRQLATTTPEQYLAMTAHAAQEKEGAHQPLGRDQHSAATQPRSEGQPAQQPPGHKH